MKHSFKTILPTTYKTLDNIVSREELTFRDVTEKAWILHNRLCKGAPIQGDEQATLSRVAGDLLDLGYCLDGIFDELAEISRRHPQV